MCLPHCPAHCPSFSHSCPVSSLILLLCYSVLLSVCPSYLLCPSICPPHHSQNPASFFYSIALSCSVGHCFSLYLSFLFPAPIFSNSTVILPVPFYFLNLYPHRVLIFLCPAPTPSFLLSSLPCVSSWDSPRGRWCCLQISWFSGGLGGTGLMFGL